jgi:hypothetical protein
MLAGDRRFDRRSSDLVTFGVSPAVAIAVAVPAYQPTLDVPSADRAARTVEVAAVSPRCRKANQATVGQFAAFLERNGPTDAPILERAIHPPCGPAALPLRQGWAWTGRQPVAEPLAERTKLRQRR